MAFVPVDGGNAYYEGDWDMVWAVLRNRAALSNTCPCGSRIDNGMAISWQTTVAPQSAVTYSFLTVFSPSGRVPDPPPQCRDSGADTQTPTAVLVDLPCDGVGGGARTVLAPPAHDTVTGDPRADRLTYTPNTGFTGTDTFTFVADNGSGRSNVATATIVVSPAPPAPPEPPAPADEPAPEIPDAGPAPPGPSDDATLVVTTADALVPLSAPSFLASVRCDAGANARCEGEVRANGRKVAVRGTRKTLTRVRVAVGNRIRARLKGRRRVARVRVTATPYQRQGAPRTHTRIVQLRTAGCRPAVTG